MHRDDQAPKKSKVSDQQVLELERIKREKESQFGLVPTKPKHRLIGMRGAPKIVYLRLGVSQCGLLLILSGELVLDKPRPEDGEEDPHWTQSALETLKVGDACVACGVMTMSYGG